MWNELKVIRICVIHRTSWLKIKGKIIFFFHAIYHVNFILLHPNFQIKKTPN